MSAIDDKYDELGGSGSFLGNSVGDEQVAPDGVGSYRHFDGGSIYYTPATGAHEVHGAIRGKWAHLGWERSFLGYPVTDETATPDGIGRFNHFQEGSIYWHPDTWAHEVHGEIRAKWADLGWERSFLGYPVTDETATPDGIGLFNRFQGGSIYWHPDTGASELRVLVISLGGASFIRIHGIVEECAREYGYTLTRENWLQDGGEAIISDRDARRIRAAINTLVSRNGGDKSDLALLVVGKSSGGVLAWNTFRLHYADIDDFRRAALVMVDPHGSVLGDEERGPYCQTQDLWWPDGWSSDTDVFRVYNIYQHERWFTGASFPNERVYRNIQLSENGIGHVSISRHTRTRGLITEGLNFALTGQ